jgi:hypothetical protein
VRRGSGSTGTFCPFRGLPSCGPSASPLLPPGRLAAVDYFRAARDSASSSSNLLKQATSPALEHWSLPAFGSPLDWLGLGPSRCQAEQSVLRSENMLTHVENAKLL